MSLQWRYLASQITGNFTVYSTVPNNKTTLNKEYIKACNVQSILLGITDTKPIPPTGFWLSLLLLLQIFGMINNFWFHSSCVLKFMIHFTNIMVFHEFHKVCKKYSFFNRYLLYLNHVFFFVECLVFVWEAMIIDYFELHWIEYWPFMRGIHQSDYPHKVAVICKEFQCHDIVMYFGEWKIDGLVQDCSNSSANALELLQSCTKPSRRS